MTGSSIFDYVHQGDHAEIAEQLGLSLTGRPGQTGLNSPASGSEEGSQHGTNNPDGENNLNKDNIKFKIKNKTRQDTRYIFQKIYPRTEGKNIGLRRKLTQHDLILT